MVEPLVSPGHSRVWQVGALCRAIADALEARFNPVGVAGEISGFTRAASGHCYFSLKDDTGQLRCAMFRRAASILTFAPRDGDRVEVRGRVGVYEPRGELQLVVESMRPAGQGTLLEQFLKLKEKLAAEGLFESTRKRALPSFPRGVGVVTSLGAAALHDVITALQRRVPHLAVVVAPASVQGDGAPGEMIKALAGLYGLAQVQGGSGGVPVDVILLVRGGGSTDDLWAFNDEQLARMIARSPVPVISGVGHETDFTIADFVADVRAPTPTAAAEMVTEPTAVWASRVDEAYLRMQRALVRSVERQSQRLDKAATRLGRPSSLAHRQRLLLASLAQRHQHAARVALQVRHMNLDRRAQDFLPTLQQAMAQARDRTHRAELRLGLLDPSLVLKRGYAWLTMENGHTLSRVGQAIPGQTVTASLTDGTVAMVIAD